MVPIAKYRDTSYVSHVSVNFEVKSVRTCPFETSYEPKITVIYIK